MQPYQERVVQELKELRDRRKKLHAFIAASNQFHQLPEAEQDRLQLQLQAMLLYEGILEQRVKNFLKESQ